MGSKTMKKTIKLVMQQCKLFQFKDLIKLVVVVVVVVVVIKVSYLRHKCNKFNVNKKIMPLVFRLWRKILHSI